MTHLILVSISVKPPGLLGNPINIWLYTSTRCAARRPSAASIVEGPLQRAVHLHVRPAAALQRRQRPSLQHSGHGRTLAQLDAVVSYRMRRPLRALHGRRPLSSPQHAARAPSAGSLLHRATEPRDPAAEPPDLPPTPPHPSRGGLLIPVAAVPAGEGEEKRRVAPPLRGFRRRLRRRRGKGREGMCGAGWEEGRSCCNSPTHWVDWFHQLQRQVGLGRPKTNY